MNVCTVSSSLFVYSFCKEILLVSLDAFAEAEQIRNQYSEATTKLATVQHQISDLESKLKGDFGRVTYSLFRGPYYVLASRI